MCVCVAYLCDLDEGRRANCCGWPAAIESGGRKKEGEREREWIEKRKLDEFGAILVPYFDGHPFCCCCSPVLVCVCGITQEEEEEEGEQPVLLRVECVGSFQFVLVITHYFENVDQGALACCFC